MQRITGNKGEWSEIYVLLKLIADRKIYAADENAKKIDEVFFPILNIYRDERSHGKTNYDLTDDKSVRIYIDNTLIYDYDYQVFSEQASYLLNQLLSTDSKRSFSIPQTESFMDVINCQRIAAISNDKSDIIMKIHDFHNGFEPICGFSIKSELGAAPTLVNASKATNFIYKIDGITETEEDNINSIDTTTKIKDRMEAIFNNHSVKFYDLNNKNFYYNLMKIDTSFPLIMAYALIYHYRDGIISCKDIVEKLEKENPLNYPVDCRLYDYKFKKFLCSVALGMMPSKLWDGKDEATGGYIIVRSDGEVLAFYIYNRNMFEQYLLDNTKFERGSTSKHDYASIYKIDDEYYINLNLSIRFLK